MIFSSLQYLIFLPIAVFLYWRTRGGARLAVVVGASYLFYMSWLPAYGLLLFFLTCTNWLLGLAIESSRDRWRKAWLGGALIINLGSLFHYKYTNFVLENLAGGFNWVRAAVPWLAGGIPAWDAPALNILLPLGISFFVFEFVHYTVDVYRGDKPVKSWMEFAAFASFFPSQIAGPIKRYQDFVERLRQPEQLHAPLFKEAMTLIVRGLFKKVAIADPIGAVVFTGFSSSHALSCSDSLIASIGFVIQVYCDFSGYTDIGRGSALLMGIRLPENFQLPYLSHDLADFWRRWHMSLSFWLRDYVYIPLGGSRGNRLSGWRNLFITMTACGLWHGAAWHYVIFGALQGVGLIVNREWRHFVSSVKMLKALSETWAARQLGTLLTMAFITATYTIFRAPDMAHAFNVFAGLADVQGACTLGLDVVKSGAIQFLAVYMAFWILSEALARANLRLPWLWSPAEGYVLPVRLASWTASVILMIAAKPVEACPFVYFQF